VKDQRVASLRLQLDALALRAILAHQNVGRVHLPTVRPDDQPTTKRYNPLYRSTVTSSSWTAPPLRLKGHPVPNDSIPPASPLHNRRLGNGNPRVSANQGGAFVI
jgi:hypothetical protein